MKSNSVFVVLFSLIVTLFSSCHKNTILDNPQFQVLEKTVKNGDKVTFVLLPGEKTNVELEVVFYWQGKKIGEVNKEPYRMEYLVESVAPGTYLLTCDLSYSEKTAVGESKGSIKGLSQFIQVVANQEL